MDFVSGLKNLGPAKENFFVHMVSCQEQEENRTHKLSPGVGAAIMNVLVRLP